MSGAYFVQTPYGGDKSELWKKVGLTQPSMLVISPNGYGDPMDGVSDAVDVASGGYNIPWYIGAYPVLNPLDYGKPEFTIPDWANEVKGIGGMARAGYRLEALAMQKAFWKRVVALLGMPYGFYVGHELSVSHWHTGGWPSANATRVAWFLQSSVQDAWAIGPHLPVLWSPYAYGPPVPMDNGIEFRRVISLVNSWIRSRYGQATNPIQIALQDGVGAGAARGRTKEDAVTWAKILGPDVSLNVENFITYDQQTFSQCDPAEVDARCQFYVDSGVAIGPSWSLLRAGPGGMSWEANV